MIALIRPFLAFAAFLILSLFFTERGVKGSLSPLCAVYGAGVLCAVLGSVGLLPLAGWLFYLSALLALGWLVYRVAVKKRALPAPGYGFWFFAAAGLLLLLVFAVKQPMFTTWDEFSTWGTAAKLMKLNDGMYTSAEVGWLWTATQPPLLACLSYVVQFFGPGFSEWQHYAAIDFLLLAAMAALMAPLERKHWNIAVPLAIIGFLTPFVFTLYAEPFKVAAPWLDSLADVPMGFLFGGALAAWFGAQGAVGAKETVAATTNAAPQDAGENSGRESTQNVSADGHAAALSLAKTPLRRRFAGGFTHLLPVLLALAALTLTKDTALALGLVASVLVFVDCLFAKRKTGESLGRHIGFSALPLAACLAAVAGPFLLWAAHLSAAAGVNRFELGGVSNAGMAELFVLFFKDLFSPEKSEHFTLVLSGMPEKFLSSRSTMLGSGALACFGILVLVALAALITKEAAQRRRCILFGVFSTLGFLPYFLLITLTYIYIFRPEQAFESFERYLYPYYIGWFLAAVALLAASARQSRFVVEGKAALLGLCLLFGLRFWMLVPPHLSVVGFHSAEYAERRAFEARVDELCAQLDENGKTFVISTDDVGIRWFTYCYAFLPWQVDYSYGGGAFEERELQPDGTRLVTPIDADGWAEHLIETGCTTVFIDRADEAFAQQYGGLFEDGMQAYFNEETVVYDVVVDEGEVTLVSADIVV